MKTDKLNILIERVFFYFLLAFLIAAILGRFLTFYAPTVFNRTTFIVNLLFQLFLVYIFFRYRFSKKYFIYICILIASYFIGQAFLKFQFLEINALYSELITGDLLQLNKYIYLLLFIPVYQPLATRLAFNSTVFKWVRYTLIINSFFILSGFIFEIDFFKSYPGTDRFGYMGVISTNTFTQFIYIIFITLLYYRYLKNKEGLVELIFFCLVSLLIGKKANLLFLALLVLYHFCIIKKHRVFYRFLALGLISIMIILKDKLINLFLEIFPFWKSFDMHNNIWSVITSHRDIRFNDFLNFAESYWKVPNYIFGGINFPSSRVEMSLIDIYIFFGIAGLIIFYKVYRDLIFNIKSKYILLPILIIVISFFTGSFFVNVNLIIIFYLLICNLYPDNFSSSSYPE